MSNHTTPSTAVARNQREEPINAIKRQVSSRAEEFKAVLPSHISFDRFQRTITTAVMVAPKLLECDRHSLLVASMQLAQDGLLPDGREAALVPFRTWNPQTRQSVYQVQAMPMVWGLRKKILQSGEIISLETGLVYRAEIDGGHFIYEVGINPPIRHRPRLDMSDEEMADDQIVAAYSIARLKNEHGGDPYWSVEVMRRAEINKVRQASQTGAIGRVDRQGKEIRPSGPWVDWYGEMARKTVLRRHTKTLPMSGEVVSTFERDDVEELRARKMSQMLEMANAQPLALPDDKDVPLIGNPEAVSEGDGEPQASDDDDDHGDDAIARKLDAEALAKLVPVYGGDTLV